MAYLKTRLGISSILSAADISIRKILSEMPPVSIEDNHNFGDTYADNDYIRDVFNEYKYIRILRKIRL